MPRCPLLVVVQPSIGPLKAIAAQKRIALAGPHGCGKASCWPWRATSFPGLAAGLRLAQFSNLGRGGRGPGVYTDGLHPSSSLPV